MKKATTCQDFVQREHAPECAEILFAIMLCDEEYTTRELAKALRRQYQPFSRLARRTLDQYTRAVLYWMLENTDSGDVPGLVRKGRVWIAPSISGWPVLKNRLQS